ncbi:MAG: tetratricopeptide repeat protein [Planctomycetota bacterium]|jgi:predicted O-linked N-acetylglucosamine transferase (SPINDLY family)
MTNIKDLFQKGYKYHQSGNLAAAATFYLKVLDKQPEHTDTIFLTGTLYLQQGNFNAAAVFLNKALELKPDYAKAHNNLGTVFKEEGKFDDAVASYRRAIELEPDYAEAHNNLGAAFQAQGKLSEALSCYQKTLELKPDYAKVHYNLGALLQEQGKYNEAVASYNRSIEITPNHAETYYNLGIILHIQNKHDEAISSYQKALKLKPDFVEAHINIGNMFKDQGKFNEALFSYQNALRLKPDPVIEVKVALLLPIINESRESIKWYRNKLIEQIGSIKTRGLTLDDPQKQIGSTNFYLAYHGLNDRKIQENIASFYTSVCPDLVWTPPVYNKQRQTHDKIKIGIISNFLCNHTIGKLNYGIIKHLSRDKFHVKLFRFSGGKEDPLSEAINNAADEVVILPRKLKPARQEIADHSLDILFYLDIGMDSLTYFLAFSRLAPVQCVTWGHPVTTGIPNMDYFISSDNAEPPGAENHYSERLILPDRLTTYYYRPELPEEYSSREKLGLPEDYNLYVCPQTLFKFHPDFDNVLGDILRQDPRGLLVLIEGNHKHWTELLRERFSSAFPDVIDRVRFLHRMSPRDFLSLLKTADVILDTPYFGGGNTSLESFACGMPIVTWPGEFMRDRLTLALYKQMGVMDCVANDAQSYLKIAYRLANDKIWRDEIKGKIKANADVLYEDIEAVRELERFFETAVENGHIKKFSNLIASYQVS